MDREKIKALRDGAWQLYVRTASQPVLSDFTQSDFVELCRLALIALDAEARAEILNHAGYIAGQEDMRERAAKAAASRDLSIMSSTTADIVAREIEAIIRNIPIEGEKK